MRRVCAHQADRQIDCLDSASGIQKKACVPIGKALIESRRSGAAGAGNGAHGEGLLSAFAQNTVRSIEDAAFQTSISLARHSTTLSLTITLHYILYIVKDTMYKEYVPNDLRWDPQNYGKTGAKQQVMFRFQYCVTTK